MRWLIAVSLIVFPSVAWAGGWARVDKTTARILLLSETEFTSGPPDGQQDVELSTDATSFAKKQLGGCPTEWRLDPATKRVSHDFAPLPTPADMEKAKDPSKLTLEDRVKRLEIILGVQ